MPSTFTLDPLVKVGLLPTDISSTGTFGEIGLTPNNLTSYRTRCHGDERGQATVNK